MRSAAFRISAVDMKRIDMLFDHLTTWNEPCFKEAAGAFLHHRIFVPAENWGERMWLLGDRGYSMGTEAAGC